MLCIVSHAKITCSGELYAHAQLHYAAITCSYHTACELSRDPDTALDLGYIG